MALAPVPYTYDIYDVDHYIRIVPELQILLYYLPSFILRSYEFYPLTCTTP